MSEWWYDGISHPPLTERVVILVELGDRVLWDLELENEGNMLYRCRQIRERAELVESER